MADFREKVGSPGMGMPKTRVTPKESGLRVAGGAGLPDKQWKAANGFTLATIVVDPFHVIADSIKRWTKLEEWSRRYTEGQG